MSRAARHRRGVVRASSPVLDDRTLAVSRGIGRVDVKGVDGELSGDLVAASAVAEEVDAVASEVAVDLPGPAPTDRVVGHPVGRSLEPPPVGQDIRIDVSMGPPRTRRCSRA